MRSVVLVGERPIEELDERRASISRRGPASCSRASSCAHAASGAEPRLVGRRPARGDRRRRRRHGARSSSATRRSTIEGRFRARRSTSALAWQEWTGLPFVFAAWCGRPGALSTRRTSALLERRSAAGLARRDAIADEHAARTRPAARRRSAPTSGDAIRYDLGDDERAGLERFYDEAARAGLLPRAQVRFFDDDRRQRPDRRRPSLDALLARAADGERLSAAEGERLLAEASLFDLGLAADAVRRRKHPHGVVTYIVDRNVNYTNVCTTSCRFCAFYRPAGHPEGYVLSREELGKKLQEVVDAGGVQILLQGGLHPELRIEWYEDLFRWMKREYRLGLHALSPEEILHIARLEGLTRAAASSSACTPRGSTASPAAGREILVDRVRRKIAKAKCTSDEWLGVMRVAHQMGLRSSATMMYGTVDTPRDRVDHLVKIRDLQDETGGFTAFFCWDFQHEQGTRIEPGDHGHACSTCGSRRSRASCSTTWTTSGPRG